MKKLVRVSAMVLCLVLSSCGGGGEGSGGGSVTPTPTPTPTVSPSYDLGFDLSIFRSFDSGSASYTLLKRYNDDSPTFYDYESSDVGFGQELSRITYDQSSKEFTVVHEGNSITFGEGDVSTEVEGGISYAIDSEDGRFDSFLITRGPDGMDYVNITEYDVRTSYFDANPGIISSYERTYFLTGSQTIKSDLPNSGISVYDDIFVKSYYGYSRNLPSSGTSIDINHALGIVSGSTSISSFLWENDIDVEGFTITFSGIVSDGSNGVRGTISSVDSKWSGDFTGYFFGPNAEEIGLLYTIVSTDGIKLAGVIVGNRN